MSHTASILRALKVEALDIYRHALESVKVDSLMRNAVRVKNDTLILGCKEPAGNHLTETQIDLKVYSPHVIGGGKSVLAMACELAKIVGQYNINHLFSHGLISLPGGLRTRIEDTSTLESLDSIKVRCLFGSETNVPNKDSVHASELMMEEVDKACQQDRLNGCIPLFIVLLSGGGSSCLTSPRYISLDEKLHLINSLVQKGADIVELNKIRRFFSNIKGGKLARHILTCEPQSKIISLIMSDVIGDPVEFIASGPTHLDDISSHYNSMLQVLEKYGCDMGLTHFDQDANAPTDLLNQPTNYIIGNNTIAIKAAIKRAEELKYSVRNLGHCLDGPTEKILDNIWCSRNFELKYPNEKMHKTLVIGGGEATINKLESDTWGKGGRAQEMALDFLINSLQEKDCPFTVRLFLAGSTDGQDGPTDVAACLASAADKSSKQTYGLQEVLRAKRSHDSFNFWNKYYPKSLIKTGLTGTNVMDLYMLLSSHINNDEKQLVSD